MLTLRIGGREYLDETTSEFVKVGGSIVELEHSLLSVSKWESIYERPFFAKGKKTAEEMFAYIRFMCLDPNLSPALLQQLNEDELKKIISYIDMTRTATTVPEPAGPPGRPETITSELIYYWMVAFRIPFECQTWHINRLLTLIRVCNFKQEKPKKMSRAQRRELNAQRKAKLGTTG